MAKSRLKMLSGEDAPFETDWLSEPLDLAECEARERNEATTDARQKELTQHYIMLHGLMEPGDTYHYYCTPRDFWIHLAGRAGECILRNTAGSRVVVYVQETLMN